MTAVPAGNQPAGRRRRPRLVVLELLGDALDILRYQHREWNLPRRAGRTRPPVEYPDDHPHTWATLLDDTDAALAKLRKVRKIAAAEHRRTTEGQP